ncbi:MAG: hypothetical protein IIA05_06000 [Proteobacteria bacterium]|nr:hypothetical protein [Pseudomonadota bacterium]
MKILFAALMKIGSDVFNWVRKLLSRTFDFLAGLIIVALRIIVMTMAYLSVVLAALWVMVKCLLYWLPPVSRGIWKFLMSYLALVFTLSAFIPEKIETWVSYAKSLRLGEEYPQPSQFQHTGRIARNLLNMLKADYVAGDTRRDAHPKHHGLVKARLKVVVADIPKDLRQGLFSKDSKDGQYDAWVRFSNSSPSIKPDGKPDVRGMAIKICHPPGERLEHDGISRNEQDFLLVSHDVFPVNNIGQYEYLTFSVTRGGIFKLIYFAYCLIAPWRWYVIRNLLLSVKRHRILTEITWNSITAYRFGVRNHKLAVKFIVKFESFKLESAQVELKSASPTVEKDRSRDFLRHGLRKQLKQGDVILGFYVQRQVHPYKMPVERAAVSWSKKLSEPVKVGTLTIPKQRFDTSEMMWLCEHISFSPWNCLKAHRPLGSLNRARRDVYRSISSFRHGRNEIPIDGPSCTDLEAAWQRAQANDLVVP